MVYLLFVYRKIYTVTRYLNQCNTPNKVKRNRKMTNRVVACVKMILNDLNGKRERERERKRERERESE